MSKTAIAIRHVFFEGLGHFERPLRAAGYEIHYVEAGVEALDTQRLDAADLLCVLGGPIGADQEALYPFLRDELRTIETRLAAQKPVLGICLGAQLMARAAGARVYPGAAKEIGYAPLLPTGAGQHSCLAPLSAVDWQVLHWHGDTFDLPQGAVHLAGTKIAAHQAYTLGQHALALQFHMEADPAQLEHWLIGHCFELMHANIDIPALRAKGKTKGASIAAAGAKALTNWLSQLDCPA